MRLIDRPNFELEQALFLPMSHFFLVYRYQLSIYLKHASCVVQDVFQPQNSFCLLLFRCSSHMCLQCTDLCCKLLTGVLAFPHQPPVFLFMSSICSQLSPFLCLFPSSPTRCLSAIFLLFFKKYVRAQSQRLQAFPHKQPNLSSWFSACLFWVFLRDDISAGKPNGPERVLSLWGASRRMGKNRKVFFGKWN